MNDIRESVLKVTKKLEDRITSVFAEQEDVEVLSVLIDGFYRGIQWLTEHTPKGELKW